MVKLLLLDNYDSFTYNLYDYLCQCGAVVQVYRNDEITVKQLMQQQFHGIVLSPGPKKPKDAGILFELIHHFHATTPMLGICLGHQAIGEYFGAKLIKAPLPMHGKTSVITHHDHPVFKDIPPQVEVMRYHSLLLESLENTPLQVIAHTSSGEIMGLCHQSLPLTGLQFHPESILTEFGLTMVRNWVKMMQHDVLKQLQRPIN